MTSIVQTLKKVANTGEQHMEKYTTVSKGRQEVKAMIDTLNKAEV